jgi:hypothetical protein
MGKPQMFSFEPDQVSDVLLFGDCSIAFCVSIDHISGYGMVLHQGFDSVFSGLVV